MIGYRENYSQPMNGARKWALWKPSTNEVRRRQRQTGEYVSECCVEVKSVCASEVLCEQSFFLSLLLPSSPTKKRYGNRDAEGSTPGTCVGPESHLKRLNPGSIFFFYNPPPLGNRWSGSRARGCVCVYAMSKLRTWINVSRSLKLMCVYQVRYNV